MAYQVAAAQNVGPAAQTIPGVLLAMGGALPPANIIFSLFPRIPNTHNLGQGQGRPVRESPIAEVTRSIGLISCASVCYLNTANNLAYVFHANTGAVSQGQFMAAMVAIDSGGPTHATVNIAYAHQNANDQGYQDTINDLQGWGVPPNNIVEITHLLVNQFGMNNLLQIGY
jgi:hypothetical protein